MDIRQIKKHALQNMEHFQFASHVLSMCTEADIEKLNSVLPPLTAAIAAEDKALNQPRQEEGTKELEQLDRIRDTAYRSLQLLVDLHLHSDDTAVRASAERVAEVMARYPKAAQANYDKESGMLKNLVADLNDGPLAAHVGQLAAAAYISRLEAANTAFDLRYRSRLKSAVPSGTFDVKALRAATDAALNAVVRRMDSLDDLEPATPGLAALITQYNALVEKRRATIAHRAATPKAGHGGKGKEGKDKAGKGKQDKAGKTKEYEALLAPGLPALEQFLKLPAGSLSFTGKTAGKGDGMRYQLAVGNQTAPDGSARTIWVGVNPGGSLFVSENVPGKVSAG